MCLCAGTFLGAAKLKNLSNRNTLRVGGVACAPHSFKIFLFYDLFDMFS